jgi:hypothetical protein
MGMSKGIKVRAMKRCTKCGKTKLLSGFPKSGRPGCGTASWCRDCKAGWTVAYEERRKPLRKLLYAANADKIREASRIKKYGVTPERYKELLAAQNDRCAICLDTLVGGKQTHIDHVHDGVGRVRGLLCTRCNCGLGQFRESPEILAAATVYLKKHV